MKIANQIAILTLAALAAPAFADRDSTTKTNWAWKSNVSSAEIKKVIDKGYRITDLEVSSTSPWRYTATFVKNSGSYKIGWWWKTNLTSDELKAYYRSKKARILDLEVHRIGGKTKFSAVMVKNTGAVKKSWWWVTGKTLKQVEAKAKKNGARVIDLDTYTISGKRYYSAVMIKNSGKDKRDWWMYSNLTSGQVKSKMSQHKARVIDIERRGSGRYAIVLQKRGSELSWWYGGKTMAEIKRLASQNGARIIDIERYKDGGKVRYHALMLNNSNSLESRIGKMMRTNSDGTRGFYLKQVGGQVKGDLMEDFKFYPASSIKVLEHIYAWRKVMNGDWTGGTTVPVWANHTNDTHSGEPAPDNETMLNVVTRMMVNSDNKRTNAMQDFIGGGNGKTGRNRVNNICWNVLGMSKDSALRHKMADGGSSNKIMNTMTAKDLALVYEQVANARAIKGDARDSFYASMLNETRSSGFRTSVRNIIDQEAAKLKLSDTVRDNFKSRVKMAVKAGKYPSVSTSVSVGGWVRLPVKIGRRLGKREFVFAVYVETFTFNNRSVSSRYAPELLRDEIRSALATYK